MCEKNEDSKEEFWNTDLKDIEGSFLGDRKVTDFPTVQTLNGIPIERVEVPNKEAKFPEVDFDYVAEPDDAFKWKILILHAVALISGILLIISL